MNIAEIGYIFKNGMIEADYTWEDEKMMISGKQPLQEFPECCCECIRFSDREKRGVFRCLNRIIPPIQKMNCAYFEKFDQERWENYERWYDIRKMVCKKCGIEMVIDEWNGWVWTCFLCDITGRNATYKESEKQEKERIELK